MNTIDINSSQGLTLPGAEDTTGPLSFPAVQYDPSTGNVETPDLSSAANNYQILQAIQAELAAEGNGNSTGPSWLCTEFGIACSGGTSQNQHSFPWMDVAAIALVVIAFKTFID